MSNASIKTKEEAAAFGKRRSEELLTQGLAPWEVVVKVVEETAARNGAPLSPVHMRYMRQYLNWNELAVRNSGVITAIASSFNLAKWAIMNGSTPLPQEVQDLIAENRDSHLPAVVRYMEVISKTPPLRQYEIVAEAMGKVSDEVSFMHHVLDNYS
jgi:hypothetical protein